MSGSPSGIAEGCLALTAALLLLMQGFFRQESWSGCHVLLQGNLSNPGTGPGLPHCILYCLRPQGGSPNFLSDESTKLPLKSLQQLEILLLATKYNVTNTKANCQVDKIRIRTMRRKKQKYIQQMGGKGAIEKRLRYLGREEWVLELSAVEII